MVFFSLWMLLVLKLTFCFSPQSTEQVTAFCRNLHDMNTTEGPVSCSSSSSTSSSSSCVPSPISPLPVLFTPRQLSDADKLRKVISELVDTERTYVKVSICCAFKALCVMLDLIMINLLHENHSWFTTSNIKAVLKSNMNESLTLCLQDLNILIERYLNPLQKESFLSQEEVRYCFLCIFINFENVLIIYFKI